MSVAFELEFEACRPRLYALSDQPARTAPTPQVRRRRVVLAAVVLGLLVLLALPVRAFGGSTLAQAPPLKGQVYVVKAGDTLGFHRRPGQPGRGEHAHPGARARGRLERRGPGGARFHSLTIVGGVRCPWCSVDDDRVVDSRQAEEGGAIRRRRECLGCGRRFTTFERVEEVPLWVVKRNGLREPFDRNKVVEGVRSACKNRPVSDLEMEELAQSVEDALRAETTEPTSQQVGVAVLDRLQALDDVAYLRFASVYKGFEEAGDFQREARILTKTTEPKRK